MKHTHESFDTCSTCNCRLRECKYCGSDVAMVGGGTSGDGVICNSCRSYYEYD